jgi:hypothetical protein
MMKTVTDSVTAGNGWRSLYVIGGLAALVAGIAFRRNLGPEATILTGQSPPASAVDWFTLLRDDRLLGLILLNFFDVVDYALAALMFLALYVALRHYNKGYAAIAAVLGILGTGVFFASNSALSMLSLSDQYTAATTDAQRSMIEAAGQAVLAFDNPGVVAPGTGIYMSFLLMGAATLLFSLLMRRSAEFGKATAYAGIVAGACDLAFCALLPFAPWTGVILVATAGLFLMVWHILVGLKLMRLGKEVPVAMMAATASIPVPGDG